MASLLMNAIKRSLLMNAIKRSLLMNAIKRSITSIVHVSAPFRKPPFRKPPSIAQLRSVAFFLDSTKNQEKPYKCYLCGSNFGLYDDIFLHLKYFQCVLKDRLLPPIDEPEDLIEIDAYRHAFPDLTVKYIPHSVYTLFSTLKNCKGLSIVFVSTPDRANALDCQLGSCFISCTHIHHMMDAREIHSVIDRVRKHYFNVLITTDLETTFDVGKVDIIVNFDLPNLLQYEKRVLKTFGKSTKVVFICFHLIDGIFPTSAVPMGNKERICKLIEIPNVFLGLFIGSFGNTIKYLEQISGARIAVTKAVDPNAKTRPVQLVGTMVEISRALFLITKILSRGVASHAGVVPMSIKYRHISDLGQKPTDSLFQNLSSRYGFQGSSKKIEISRGRVGINGGKTIQVQSGEKISFVSDLLKALAGDSSVVSQGFMGQAGTRQFSMKVPNYKVSLIIGKGGETIKNIQSSSGARIQVIPLRLPPGDTSTERTIYIDGTTEQIKAARQLVNEVVSEAKAGDSSVFSLRFMGQAATGQFSMKVPNNKVSWIIGKGGETIKNMQSRSGALIQVIPLRLRPGDTSTERTIYIYGTTEQIEAARQLVNEVVSEKPRGARGV